MARILYQPFMIPHPRTTDQGISLARRTAYKNPVRLPLEPILYGGMNLEIIRAKLATFPTPSDPFGNLIAHSFPHRLMGKLFKG